MESLCSTKLRVLAAKFEGRRWSVSTSRLGRRSLTHFWVVFFLIGNDLLFCIAKAYTELGQAPMSQARPRDTDHLRPANLAARTLPLVEQKPSKFGHNPCPARPGLGAAVKCCARKARFFRCPGRLWDRTREARALCGFQNHKGENLFRFLFSDPIVVGLRPSPMEQLWGPKTNVFGPQNQSSILWTRNW